MTTTPTRPVPQPGESWDICDGIRAVVDAGAVSVLGIAGGRVHFLRQDGHRGSFPLRMFTDLYAPQDDAALPS